MNGHSSASAYVINGAGGARRRSDSSAPIGGVLRAVPSAAHVFNAASAAALSNEGAASATPVAHRKGLAHAGSALILRGSGHSSW